jgi:hypothetical protein
VPWSPPLWQACRNDLGGSPVAMKFTAEERRDTEQESRREGKEVNPGTHANVLRVP